MATFATLKTSVQTLVIDLPTVVTANVGEYVNRAMVSLQNAHRFKVMETLGGPYVTTNGSRILVQAPANFKEPRGKPYYVTNTGQVQPMEWAPSRNEAVSAFNIGTIDIGPPRLLVDGEPSDEQGTRNFELGQLPDNNSDYGDKQYRIYIPYWRYLTALSADGDHNWLTDTTPCLEYIEQMAVAYCFFADWDESRAALWQQRAQGKLGEAMREDKRYRLAAVDTFVPQWRGARAPKVRF